VKGGKKKGTGSGPVEKELLKLPSAEGVDKKGGSGPKTGDGVIARRGENGEGTFHLRGEKERKDIRAGTGGRGCLRRIRSTERGGKQLRSAAKGKRRDV